MQTLQPTLTTSSQFKNQIEDSIHIIWKIIAKDSAMSFSNKKSKHYIHTACHKIILKRDLGMRNAFYIANG